MARPTTPAYSENFLGLVDEPGTEIPGQSAQILKNLYIFNQAQQLERRKGQAQITSGTTQIDWLHWERTCGVDRLFNSHNGHIFDGLAGNPTSILPGGGARFTSGIAATAALLNAKLYIANGTDQNIRWDCTSIKQVMPSQPNPPTGVAAAPCGCNLDGVYIYKITYVSADGSQSEPSSGTTVTATGGTNVTLTIPLAGSSEDVSGRIIWRTQAGGATYYEVTGIADNTTASFVDDTTDATIAANNQLDTTAVRFPPCQAIINHQERLAGIICNTAEGDNHTLYISNYLEPEICPEIAPLDDVDDPTKGARISLKDEATALAVMGNILIVFLRGSAYRLIGDNPNNWSLDKWLDIGCVAPKAVVTHRNFLFWIGSDGAYLAEGVGTGVNVARISHEPDQLRQTFNSLTAAQMASAHCFYWDGRFYVCFPSSAFWYDTRYRCWGELTNWNFEHSTTSHNTGSNKERIFTSTSGTITECETGTDDQGAAITTQWRSKHKDMGQFGREKRIHRVLVSWTAASGDATVSLYRGAGELVDTFTQDLSEAYTTGSEVSRLDKRASEGARSEWFAVDITSETTHPTYRILQAGAHYTLCT